MEQELISVILSVYNEKKYLDGAIKSIIQQSYKNIELIIINDGSDNEINKIIQKNKTRDKRIRIINNKTNIGLTKSLNRGIRSATGKYIARMDADDISHPNRLLKQVKFLDSNRDYALCGSFATVIDKNNNRVGVKIMPVCDQEIKKTIMRFNPFIHSSLLIRKDVLLSIGCYNELFLQSQDYDLLLRIIRKYKTANLSEKLISYRESNHGISYIKMRRSLMFALIARYYALKYYEYPIWMSIYLLKPIISYFIPIGLKKFIQKYA